MTKLTKNQKATIVRLFLGGTSVANLCVSWQVSAERIETVIREAMTAQASEVMHT